MAHSERCPVCSGGGRVILPPSPNGSSAGGNSVVCYGCQGKGWVVVYEKRPKDKVS